MITTRRGFLALSALPLIGLTACSTSAESGSGNTATNRANGTVAPDKQKSTAKTYLAAVEDVHGSWGYVNEKGEEVIPIQFGGASPFTSNGLALVWTAGGTDESGDQIRSYRFIDAKGETAIDCDEYASVTSFSHGLAAVYKIAPDGLDELDGIEVYAKELLKAYDIGFIDKKGRETIPCGTFRVITSSPDPIRFNGNGLAAVGVYTGVASSASMSSVPTKYGLIDKKGKELTDFIYTRIMSFGDSELAPFVVASSSGSRAGYLDERGNEVMTDRFSALNTFSNGLAAAATADSNGLYGYINESGSLVIQPAYRHADLFNSDGFAAASKPDPDYVNREYYGIIDKEGNEIFPFQYARMYAFNEHGLTWAQKSADGKTLWGMIDGDDTEVVPFQYDNLEDPGDNGFRAAGVKSGITNLGDDGYTTSFFDETGNIVLELDEKYLNTQKFTATS